MTARRRRGAEPAYRPGDVASGGTVAIYRNDRGRPFGETDEHVIERPWRLPAHIAAAFTDAEKAEAELAAGNPPAWHPQFGYLSPIPEHCGTGIVISGEFHLEGLNIIGDLPPVLAALEALRLRAEGLEADGMRHAAHVFRVQNAFSLGMPERALVHRVARALEDLTSQELAARQILMEEHPRLLADAVERALAILRAARLISPWELFDLLSPVRLAASLGFIDGITGAEILDLMAAQARKGDTGPSDSSEEDRRRDARDAALADRTNRRFADVTFTMPAA